MLVMISGGLVMKTEELLALTLTLQTHADVEIRILKYKSIVSFFPSYLIDAHS